MKHVLRRLTLLSGASLVVLLAAALTTSSATTLQIDAHHYVLETSTAPVWNHQLQTLRLPSGLLTQCRRANGDPVPSGVIGIQDATGSPLFQVNSPVVLDQGDPKIKIQSASGDVICDGVPSVPIAVFADAFE